jgi:hypothetical protein
MANRGDQRDKPNMSLARHGRSATVGFEDNSIPRAALEAPHSCASQHLLPAGDAGGLAFRVRSDYTSRKPPHRFGGQPSFGVWRI